MIIKHVYGYSERVFETEVQKVVNEVLNERGCSRKLGDIKYSAVCESEDASSYSALLIFT